MPAHHLQNQQRQQSGRGGFHAAARGGGGRAHEHQRRTDQLARIGQRGLVQRGKARRAEGDGLEKAVVELLPHREPVIQRAGVVPLQRQDGQRAKGDQPGGHGQHQLGVQGELAPAKARSQAFQNHRKAQPAQQNEGGQRQENHGLVLKMRQAPVPAEKIKPRVAKRAHRCEQALPHAPRGAVERDEAGHEQQRAAQLHHQRDQEKRQRQPHHAAERLLVHGVAQDHAVPQRDAPAQRHQDQRGEGHEAQPAHLNEHKQHRLPEEGQLHAHIHDRQARDAHGGGGGEHRLADAHGPPVGGGHGQSEHESARHDQQEKAQGQKTLGLDGTPVERGFVCGLHAGSPASWEKIAAFERNTGVLYSFFPLLYSRFSAKKTPFAAGGGQRGFGDQKPTGSKSAAPCLHRGQMKSGGSSSPS